MITPLVHSGLAKSLDRPRNVYRVTFENIKVLREHVNRIADGSYFEYSQSPKGLKFKIAGDNDEQLRQAAEDDEVKDPKEVLVEIDPNDIAEIIQSVPDEETIT
ncbi:unnamed protein product [Rotaria socialis]|uniref:Uncharacterized protein n=1 Tax=Rotaria socialis TaxID=392032 RepID=A0A818JF97_9BILA|nr:unnamed protein product [Rotaria socialis]CAF4279117.1 unnamed protein product [Rotaria socialis]